LDTAPVASNAMSATAAITTISDKSGRVARARADTLELARDVAERACGLSEAQPSDDADELAELAVDLLARLELAA
jgi:hypothetical protein